ncbi:hypothetical protein ATANTOWER_017395 [Ataeniobius toweri]|uniref:Uncharacterized protein n=1 Tax=Ataeniobius toweri TaxID=208326 RepID=A0ABU7BS61_9TELE|nr:hypothetical protein [Ataeniobius toweri]
MFTEISGDNGLSDNYESLKRGYCERGRRANCGIQAAAFPSLPPLALVHAGKDPSEARDRTEYFCLVLRRCCSRDSLRARPAPPPPAEAAARCRQAEDALLHFASSLWRCLFGRQCPAVAVDRHRGFKFP